MVLERRTLIVRSPHWLIIAILGMWTKLMTLFNGAVAQLGERRTCTAKVAGSSPVCSTNTYSSSEKRGNLIKSFLPFDNGQDFNAIHCRILLVGR